MKTAKKLKQELTSKWSNWWCMSRNVKQLNNAFEKELNEFIDQLCKEQREISYDHANYYDISSDIGNAIINAPNPDV